MEYFQTTEKINTTNLNKILNSRVYEGKIESDTVATYAQLGKLRKQLKPGETSQVIEFEPKKENRKPFGRLYPKKKGGKAPQTLQDLPRNIRKALADDYYYDVDIKNAYPTILNQVLERNGIVCKSLRDIVNDREKYLAIAPKEAWNAFIHWGTPKGSQEGSPEWDFFIDVATHMKMLLALPEFQKYQQLGRNKKPINPNGSAIAYLAQDIERAIVSSAIGSFQSQGYFVGTVIHDGFLVEKSNKELDDDVLRKAEEAIVKETGYKVELVIKPMDDYDAGELWSDNASSNSPDMGDAESAQAFLEWCEEQGLHLMRSGDSCLWYKQEEGIWVSEKNFNALKPYMTKAGATGHLPRDYAQMTRHKDALLKELTQLVPNQPDFFTKANSTTYRRIAFNNGIYNFETKELEPFSHKYCFFYKLPWDYGDLDTATAEKIKAKVLNPIFVDDNPLSDKYKGQCEVRDYYMKILARASAQETSDKLFYLFVGLGNSGKGVLSKLIENSFVQGGFVGNYNGDSLTANKKSEADIEKNNSWLIGLMNKRFAIGNEIDQGKQLSAQKIKTFASGGDTIKARLLHANATDYVPAFTPFLLLNDIPGIDNADDATRNRMMYIRTPFRFLPPGKYEEAIKSGSQITKKADQALKDKFLADPKVQQTFVRMVIDAYEEDIPVPPELVQEETSEWTKTEVTAESVLIEMIERTNNDKDNVTCAELERMMEQSCKDRGIIKPSKVKLGMMMTALGLPQGKVRRGNGSDAKTHRGYKGIKLPSADIWGDYTVSQGDLASESSIHY